MNLHELNLVLETHNKTMLSVIHIINKRVENPSSELLKDLLDYNTRISYEIEETISGQAEQLMSEVNHGFTC